MSIDTEQHIGVSTDPTLTLPCDDTAAEIPDDLATLHERYHEILGQLDMLGSELKGNALTSIFNIVGVVAGIKQAATINLHSIPLDQIDTLRPILDKLGLRYRPLTHGSIKQVLISRSAETLQELMELMQSPDYLLDGSSVNATVHRKVGNLLGYPQTSTEHFLHRKRYGIITDELVEPDGEAAYFTEPILSPDHMDDEVNSYVRPLMEATRLLTPNTYAKIICKNMGYVAIS